MFKQGKVVFRVLVITYIPSGPYEHCPDLTPCTPKYTLIHTYTKHDTRKSQTINDTNTQSLLESHSADQQEPQCTEGEGLYSSGAKCFIYLTIKGKAFFRFSYGSVVLFTSSISNFFHTDKCQCHQVAFNKSCSCLDRVMRSVSFLFCQTVKLTDHK